MSPRISRILQPVLALAGLMFFSLPARALMQWNEGRERLHVTAGVVVVLDSNIYASSIQEEDLVYSANIGAEYRRHAGLIGMNATFGVLFSEFSENKEEGFNNPSARIEFNKDTGRTTGSLGLFARRSNRADPSVNVRTDSWAYGVELDFKYPVSERHALSGDLGWRRIDYADNNFFVDLDSYSLSADWFYVYTPQRDLFGGYRLRLSEAADGSFYTDHSLSAGVAGRIITGLNGTARFGYQVREATGTEDATYTGYNAALSATWSFTRQMAVSATVSNDFNITSTNLSTETLSGNLDLQYARGARLTFAAGVGGGTNKFLGTAGGGRKDTFFTYYGRVAYSFSERLRLSLTYTYYKNWSTLPFSDFDRRSITFDANTRF